MGVVCDLAFFGAFVRLELVVFRSYCDLAFFGAIVTWRYSEPCATWRFWSFVTLAFSEPLTWLWEPLWLSFSKIMWLGIFGAFVTWRSFFREPWRFRTCDLFFFVTWAFVTLAFSERGRFRSLALFRTFVTCFSDFFDFAFSAMCFFSGDCDLAEPLWLWRFRSYCGALVPLWIVFRSRSSDFGVFLWLDVLGAFFFGAIVTWRYSDCDLAFFGAFVTWRFQELLGVFRTWRFSEPIVTGVFRAIVNCDLAFSELLCGVFRSLCELSFSELLWLGVFGSFVTWRFRGLCDLAFLAPLWVGVFRSLCDLAFLGSFVIGVFRSLCDLVFFGALWLGVFWASVSWRFQSLMTWRFLEPLWLSVFGTFLTWRFRGLCGLPLSWPLWLGACGGYSDLAFSGPNWK